MDNVQNQAQPVEKKPRFQRFVNSPWLFLVVPVLAGALWLVNNLWVITNNLDKPYLMLIAPVMAATVLGIWLVIKFFAAISRWAVATWKATMAARKEDPIAWFFWVTIYGLLAVSVLGSGAFFEKHFPHPFPGVGYAIALMFDLVTINAMRARLEALRTGDRSVSWLYLVAIFVCTSATVFGNVYSALDFVNRVPQEMKDASPWLAIIFPSMIIVMSILADHLLEKTSTRLDAATYRVREEQRLNILVVRREMRERIKAEEEKLAKLDAKPKKERRTFFLVRWFFPLDTDMQALSEQVAEETKQTYQPQLEEMQKQLSLFVQNAQSAYNNLASLVEKQSLQIADIDRQRDADNGLIAESITASHSELLQQVQAQINDAIQSVIAVSKNANTTVVSPSYTEPYSENTDEVQAVCVSPAQKNTGELYAQTINDAINHTPATPELASLDLDPSVVDVLEKYPEVYYSWIEKSVKSVSLDDIADVTGHSKRRLIKYAGKAFKRTPKNANLYTVSSVVEWLKTAPTPNGKTDEIKVVKPTSDGTYKSDVEEMTA